MTVRFVPRRSVLYVPAARESAWRKAARLPVDAVVLDLEDATAVDSKEDARRQACVALAERQFGEREVVIRINGLDTPWGLDDLGAIASARPDAILLPKVSGREELARVQTHLDDQGVPDTVRLWAMIETPLGVLRADSIADHGARLDCLVMGTSDLAKELHARASTDRDALLTSLSLTLLAARAHGLCAIDGVHLDLNDDDGFRTACEQGLALGFDGKSLIHPRQLAVCNAIFSPSAEHIEQARRVIDAFAAAQAAGQGVAVLDGRLVENLHAAEARHLLAFDQALREREAAGERGQNE